MSDDMVPAMLCIVFLLGLFTFLAVRVHQLEKRIKEWERKLTMPVMYDSRTVKPD